MSAFYLAAARGLTLARLASIPLFLFLLVQTSRAGPQQWRLSLLLLYVCIALSDFFDGRLARKAGAPSHVWGQIDAAADIAFTSESCLRLAWACRPGPGWCGWVGASSSGTWATSKLQERLIEDRPAKPQGDLHLLVEQWS
jgi:phosphatidylglycerophosphate synthase